ncbi:MAG: right-handed parallel beta-helix repeat-containing protein [Phycisphaerales bacterium]
MLRFASVLFVGAAAGAITVPASASTIFVNANQALPIAFQTGASWTFAYKSLQTAISEAVAGDEIWVAAGTYKPTSTTDRSATFQLKNGVRMLGGFQVGALSLDERDTLANPTFLSGAIGGASSSDNSFHVVSANAVNGATVLAGFIITAGNANGAGSDMQGAGMKSLGAPRVVDCVFVGNAAASTGGGVHSFGGSGGASPEFINCVFSGNTAGGTGGAADIQNAPARFFFCTICENSGGLGSSGGTGGIRFLNAGTSGMVANSIVRNNHGSNPSTLEDQVRISSSTVEVKFDNIEGGAGAGPQCIDADAAFVDPIGADGVPGTLDDNLRLRGSSPCIDKAASNTMPADFADADADGNFSEPTPVDLAGSLRRVEDFLTPNAPSTVNPAPDMGAYEFQRPRTIVVDKDATGANNGQNWTDAYTDLQSAIQELNDPKFGGPGEIWVAEGTYKPTTGTNQTISFILPLHGQMYGGFAGGELDRTQRDWVAHPTILSGEIGNQAATFDNTDTVVLANGALYLNDTVLDGFVVTRGADGPAGGILTLNNASPTIRNCRIIDNVSGVKFTGNQSGKPVIDNCIVHGNLNFGIDYTFTDVRITNCTVAFNTSPGFNSGAGIRGDGSDGEIRNCLVFGNVGNGLSGQPAQIGKPSGDGVINAVISCCAIQGFNGSFPNDVNCFAIGADGGVVDANGADNVGGTNDDDFTVAPCSDLIDAGDNSVAYVDTTDYDSDGNVAEPLNEDFAGAVRRVDLPVPNSGLGSGAIDIGAFEKQVLSVPDADFDNDGDVDAADLGVLLGAWSTTSGAVDLNGDCFIDAADLAILLGAWT